MTDVTAPGSDDLVLAAEFPAVTRQQWQRLVAKVLRVDADVESPERRLATITADGIEIEPLYVADGSPPVPGYPGQPPFVRGRGPAGNRTGWDVRQRHEHPDPAVAREQIMEDLEGGVSSLWLGLGDGRIPVESLPDVLAETYLDLAPIVLDAGPRFAQAAQVYFDVAAGRGVPPGALAGCLGADPLGVLARTGVETGRRTALPRRPDTTADLPTAADGWPLPPASPDAARPTSPESARSWSTRCPTTRPAVPTRRSSAAPSPRASSTCGRCGRPGFPPTRRSRSWNSATPRPPTSSRRSPSCGPPAGSGPGSPSSAVSPPRPAGQWQHAVSSWSMLTRRDPWNNILRATLACFSAGVGGADAITVAPFDAAIGQPDRLARRVARNVHALLVEESHVARVIDPAGGSWYVEDLTGQLAVKAWAWFQEIERAGGLRAALASGLIAGRLAASREQRRDALARRQRGRHRGQRVPAGGGDPAQPARRGRPGRRAGRATTHPLVPVARGAPRPRRRPRPGNRFAADAHPGAA